MAHIAAGRGLGLLSFYRLSSTCLKDKLFVVGRIHPATLKEFPRAKPQKAYPPRKSCIPRQFALNSAVRDSSSPLPFPSNDETVILSSKECPDGSILFVFGNPEEELLNEADSKSEKQSLSTNNPADDSDVSQNGSTTSDLTNEAKELETISMKATETTEQSDLVSAKDTSSLTCLQVDSEDVAGQAGDKSLSSTESEKQGLLRLRSGGAIRPHPEKVKTGGEDAYFIEGDFWIGIADGVGGWARNGIDSGLFSRELMRHCAVIARSMVDEPDPVSVIDKGVEKCEEIGSSTAVVAVLHDQTLHIANIGDSGFIVVRDGKVLTKSKPMQHGFNFPYQIGIDGDDPYDAEEFQVKVASGDVVVLATDGVFDNLYEREIVDLVNQGQAKRVEPGTVALWLVKLAHAAGLNSTGRSPFSDEANAVGYNYSGGKLDDATAVVSYIE